MDNKIHVALAVYDPSGTYAQHAGVAITSLFEHTESPVIIHLLHDNTLTDLNRERFIKTAEKYKQTIDFVNVERYESRLSKDVISIVEKTWTIGTLYRLFIPEVLPELERIIYMDCDVIVNLDIAELWNIDIEDNCLGGVKDLITYKTTIPLYRNLYMKFNKCIVKEYINAGILIMNLNKIRELGDLFIITANWLKRHRYTAEYSDQDALNSIFLNSIKFLEPKFNYFLNSFVQNNEERRRLNIDVSERIIHITGAKPWNSLNGFKTEQLYWRYYLKSAWAELGDENNIEELIIKLAEVAAKHPRLHMHTKQCYKHIAHRLRTDAFNPELFRIPKLIIQEFIARIKYRN